MHILIVTGRPLRLNSSANLCHIAYINGLIHNGCTVDLLQMSEKNLTIDESIEIPKFRKVYEYDGSIYSQMASAKHSNTAELNHANSTSRKSLKSVVLTKIKDFIRTKVYGVYAVDIAWYYRVLIGFRQRLKYDLVISLAYPPISHKVAELILKRNVTADKWIQIWEDPWSLEPGGNFRNKGFLKEEHRVLKNADEVIYVSPITLQMQLDEFSEHSYKMRWLPLPTYYKPENFELDFSELFFGYFGDYNSNVRNLKPFYNAASENNLCTYICGSSDVSFVANESVHVYPRLPIYKLKEFEDKTNVLVFLCNLSGGQIPGKIYQQSATNKLILFILDGTDDEKQIIKDYFSQFNRYIFCENNEESIKKAIDSIPKILNNDNYTKPLTVFEPKNIANCIINGSDLKFE